MNITDILRLAGVSMALATLAGGLAFAQDTEEEASFDEALNQFGYTGGAAWQCSAAEDQEMVVRQATEVFHRLTQLFGTERAFAFAAAFGAGTVDKLEDGSCEGLVTAFADGIKAGIPDEAGQ